MTESLTAAEKKVRQLMSKNGGNAVQTAKNLGVSPSAVYTHVRRMRKKGIEVVTRPHGWNQYGPPKILAAPEAIEFPDIPEEIDPEELWERRKRQYKRKAAYEEATRLIPVKVKDDGPICLHFFGDPHVDDNGTDILQLEAHTRLVNETDGMFAANCGDSTNNWVGRLSKLYAEQSTSAQEAWAMAEYWIRSCEKWLFMVSGNHDAWSGAGDPVKWISGKVHYGESQVRINLQFPKGEPIRVNCRHDFAGKSQWNPAHGSMKAAQMGYRDHVLVNGHRHASGYGVIKCPATGVISHCIQVASYKIWDRYAKEKGFPDQHLSPCADVIINPTAQHPAELVKVYWCPYEAADVLTFLRSRK